MQYEIAESNSHGGKAGYGRNKTATIQVREPIRPGEYLLKAQFRYTVGDLKSHRKAHKQAEKWIARKRKPGRPLAKKPKRNRITFVLDDEQLKLVDRYRGSLSPSRYARARLLQFFRQHELLN